MSQNPINSNGEVCFMTFTVTAWVDVFTRPAYRHIMVDSLKHCQQKKGLQLYGWCLMSNHIHLLGSANEGIVLNDIIRDMKKFTSKKIVQGIQFEHESRKEWMLNMFGFCGKSHRKEIEYKFWQDDFDCYEVVSNNVFDQKLDYIHSNPVRAEIVAEPHHYLYSSARNYADLKGLLDVIVVR